MRYLLSAFVLFIALSIHAQSAELKKGINSYEMGDCEYAVATLSEVMKQPHQLKTKEVSRGWYYLGKSKSVLISKAMSIQATEDLIKYKGYDLDAYFCFEKALAANPNEDLKALLELEITNLYYVIFNSGNSQYLLGDNSFALKYYNTAIEIAESYAISGDYNAYNLRGQTYLAMKDSTRAYADFSKATERYWADSPEVPDANIGYAYYSMAVIERYSNNSMDKALDLTQVGNERIQKESDRLKALFENGSIDQNLYASQAAQFSNIMDALNRFELDIYNASPEKYDEAVAKFKKAIADNPNDANMQLVYGNLIEFNDPQGAYEAYLKAIEIDPNQSIGHFNAGANRVNEGVKYAQKGNEEFDFKEAEKWRVKTNEQFKLALPHLEKAHELEPSNIYVLDALLQVTIQLEMNEEYQMYKEKQKVLKGY